MAPIAILFGILMTILGCGLYAASVIRGIYWHDELAGAVMVRVLTAMIPAAFGLVLIVFGAVARNGSDKVRMHTMHFAALIGLLGVGLPLWRVLKALTGDAAIDALPVGGNIAMVALSGVFLGLCVKSFIDARKARKLKETEAQSAAPPSV